MKKIALMIVVFGITLSTIKAQSGYREALNLGFKVGANLSNVYDTKGGDINTNNKFGLAVGAFLAVPLNKHLGFQPEILFSQKGFKATGSILGNSYEFTRTSNFIDIPLLFTLKPHEYFSIVIGPQYSFLLKQKDVFSNVTQEAQFKNDNIRKNILCFLGGFDFNFNRFVIGTRVGWDVVNNNGDGTSATPRYKNVWYQATLGYRLYNN